MAKRSLVTGIDIGSSAIRVVVAEYTDDGALPTVVGTGNAESRGMRHGYVINFNEAKKSIETAVRDAERRTGASVKKAFLAVGGISLESQLSTGSVFVYRADNQVTDLDTRRAMEAAEDKLPKGGNKEIIHAIPIKYRLDEEDVLGKPVNMKGTRLEVTTLFITVTRQHLTDLVSAVEECGISVEGVMAAPLAASFVMLTKRHKTAGCVLANIGAETLSVAVFENNLPISIKVFPMGGTEITNDIALGFRIPPEEAEEVKRGENTLYAKKKIEDIVNARLSDIFELIEAHLKKIGKSGLLPAGITITGGGSALPLIEELARSSLKIPARLGQPHVIKTAGTDRLADSQWSVAYGLCIMGLNDREDEYLTGGGTRGPSKILSWIQQFLP